MDGQLDTPLRSYSEWVKMCRELTADEAKARAFRIHRYSFTHRLAGLLTAHLPAKGRDQVMYAVQLVGQHARPAYLGVSSEGRRRLWDLPVGESHHLSNTYPPEIWEQVRILHWRELLEGKGHDLSKVQEEVSKQFGVDAAHSMKLIGMGIEYLFQKGILPELNARTKLRAGGFKEVSFDGSLSRQASIAGKWLVPMYPDLLEGWQELALAEQSDPRPVLLLSVPTGSIVFPGNVLKEILAGG